MMDRNKVINSISQTKDFDVVVIGGGASGIGAALEATLRGYKTVLLEKHDFTKGTSSRSTKLIHGGVRYLAQGDLKMVREALKERGYLMKNAAHLVHDQSFIIPNYRWWEGIFYTVGLKFYDLLAGKFSLGKSVHLSREKVLRKMPGISPDNLRGGVLYHDGQFDDSRLAMDMLHVLFNNGGIALNYAGVSALEKKQGKISGVVAKDAVTGNNYVIRGKTVINATGVWADEIMEMDTPDHRKSIRPSQGVHVVLDKSFLPGNHALMIPKTSDGRVLFAVPWHDHLVVGTTDTPIDENFEEPVALEEEIGFILDTASAYFQKKVNRSDVRSVFAGLRPLAAPKHTDSKTREISRNHQIIVSESNLITVIGGKWTTYRKMGQDMIDTAVKKGLLTPTVSPTKTFRLNGATTSVYQKYTQYGDNAGEIAAMAMHDPALEMRIHADLPYRWAEVEWICRNEMVVHLEDLLARRTRALLLNARATRDIAEEVANRVSPMLHWSAGQTESEVNSFKMLTNNYILD
ncbi:MAG: glycerol-3-phosphate dehydrogenase/oxidase [Bacteroidales bacterium]